MNPNGNGEADGLASDVSNVAEFLGALVPILGPQACLVDVVGYLEEAKQRDTHLAVLRHALASQQVPPSKGPGMRPVLGR